MPCINSSEPPASVSVMVCLNREILWLFTISVLGKVIASIF